MTKEERQAHGLNTSITQGMAAYTTPSTPVRRGAVKISSVGMLAM